MQFQKPRWPVEGQCGKRCALSIQPQLKACEAHLLQVLEMRLQAFPELHKQNAFKNATLHAPNTVRKWA